MRYFEKKSRRRFRSELLPRDEAQRIVAIFCEAAGAIARAGGIDDFFFQFRLHLQRQLLRLVWFLVGQKSLKPT